MRISCFKSASVLKKLSAQVTGPVTKNHLLIARYTLPHKIWYAHQRGPETFTNNTSESKRTEITQPLYPYVIWIRLIKLKHLWSGETKQLKLEKQEQKRLAEKVYWLNWGEFQAIPICPPKYYAHYVSQDSHGEIFPKLIVRWQRRFACS